MDFVKYHPQWGSTKNPVHISADVVYIELGNLPRPLYATGSLSDLPTLALYRWRFIDGKVVTTIPEGDIEVSAPLPNIVLNRPRREKISLRNHNPLDFRRVNLGNPRVAAEPNPMTIQDDIATIHLPCGNVAIIIVSSIEAVKSYKWSVLRKPRSHSDEQINIRASFADASHRRQVLLPRVVLGLDHTDLAPVYHVNGNRFDCRVMNLTRTNPNDLHH